MDKKEIKERLPISAVLAYCGAKRGYGESSYFCFRHTDEKPSLVAHDERGVATCLSPQCDIPRGADVFDLIRLKNSCSFPESVHIALALLNQPEPTYVQRVKPSTQNKKFEEIPELTDLTPRQKSWLQDRYGVGWQWVVERFQVRGYMNHIAFPIDRACESYVFIPLVKQTKENPTGNLLFYRGKIRTAQVFPNWPDAHRQARRIFVCEGEKDVLRVELELHRKRLLGEWAVITNTNGAGNLKPEISLFQNFNPNLVEEVVVCYDHDEAGKQAALIALEIARKTFQNRAKVREWIFSPSSPKGFDIGDYLRSGGQLTL